MDVNKCTIHCNADDNKKLMKLFKWFYWPRKALLIKWKKKIQEIVEKALKIWAGYTLERWDYHFWEVIDGEDID